MQNPIAESTEAFLTGLNATVREAAEEAVATRSLKTTGAELTLREELELAKAIKFVASVDGFSKQERSALQFLMIMSGIPNSVQKDVLDFDVSGVTLEHVGELFPRASRRAACVLSGAITVAAFDGLSPEEEARSRALGRQLGLTEPTIDALIGNARALGMAMSKGDRAEVEELERRRQVLLSVV
jgi:tellurite resistance protein